MACDLDIPRSIRIVPDPCGEAAEKENWNRLRFDLRDTRAHTGRASENWRYPSFYPSHNSFPASPALTDLSFVNLEDGSKVYLPCPRSCDPNVTTGDWIVYELDCEDNKYAVGGYQDCAIGTIKMWSDSVANVRPGWVALQGASAPSIATRTGKFPTSAENKFPLNKTTNLLATCAQTGVTVSLSIDDHTAATSVSIADHTHSIGLAETGITIGDTQFSASYEYVDVDCDGDVSPDHAHSVTVTGGATDIWGNAQGVGTLYSAIGSLTSPVCSSEEKDASCGGEIDLTADIVCTTGYHSHTITADYLYLDDPGHSHSLVISSHDASATTTISSHTGSATATRKIPYVVVLMIMRYDNAANAVANTSLETEVCGLDP